MAQISYGGQRTRWSFADQIDWSRITRLTGSAAKERGDRINRLQERITLRQCKVQLANADRR
jgi:hypothetical protein